MCQQGTYRHQLMPHPDRWDWGGAGLLNEWDVVTEDGCDSFSRVLVRLREIEESAAIVNQCVDLLADWPKEARN